jgi:hypothetical protein
MRLLLVEDEEKVVNFVQRGLTAGKRPETITFAEI